MHAHLGISEYQWIKIIMNLDGVSVLTELLNVTCAQYSHFVNVSSYFWDRDQEMNVANERCKFMGLKSFMSE